MSLLQEMKNRSTYAIAACALLWGSQAQAGSALQVSSAELKQLYMAVGLKEHAGQYLDSCEQPVKPESEIVDLNGDRVPEVFIWVGGSCYGAAGGELSLFVKNKQRRWEQNFGFPAGGYKLLKTKSLGYPDIELGGPGICLPIWRWNGTAYALYQGCER